MTFEVDPGDVEFALYAEDDSSCGGTPVIGPVPFAIEPDTTTVLVAWRADAARSGVLRV